MKTKNNADSSKKDRQNIVKIQRIAIIMILLAVALLSVSPIYAHADMGPKPKLTVYVTNPPAEEYYLDLLAQGLPHDGDIERRTNLSTMEGLDENMLDLLFSFSDDDWLPAMTSGTNAPMWGNIVGTKSGDKMKHEFGYYGLPSTYRIIIVTKSGEVYVTEPQLREVLQSSITYDFKTGEVDIPPIAVAYLTQFAITLTATLLIEGAILLLFRYKSKRNWLVFLLVNLATQIFMTLTLGFALIWQGSFTAFLIFFPVELGILVTEMLAYCFLLKGKSKKRNIVYAIVANLTSFIIGLISIELLATFLSRLL